MNATFPARLLLIALLTSLSAGGSAMVQAQEVSSARSSTATGASTAAKSTGTVRKAAAPQKKSAPKKAAPVKRRAPVASKSKPASEVVKTRLPPAKLDLSLPQDLVNKMQPVGTVPLSKSRPLLPQMFGEKPPGQTPFQLNGRLLSNEMDLQLRNESRREVEGAALDFEFKQ
ncbi:hypothetical protein [Pseudomonas gingeri]|uniref:Translation initiation factor 2 n=1 Tax=Pseudomonas gingeri TaxID=117681 RepID=A0A7Y7YAU3_9PSED|nr:hypothetical protein [Pseudomonas gingeri]NVZ99969.1 hypothetical protein [Pseudomonas gingeri]NWA16809.1 hypothetical protein [Pseudomonas gingeri]NWA53805.1 hypothetical protein [Pseudomonas gingeri]NWA94037.1 hypothetical protein [Pseudomonas gingeri]NWB02063.1 hypothetical protein [Pseudomonas gingeri]